METEIIVGLFTLAGTLLGYLANYGVERLRANNDKKNYISNVRFDIEIQVYKELTKSFFSMIVEIRNLIPTGFGYVIDYRGDEEAQKKHDLDIYQGANNAVFDAQNCLNSNIPFIPEELYQKFSEILRLSHKQLNVFARRWDNGVIGTYKEKSRIETEDMNRTDEISSKFSEINKDIRNHLNIVQQY